MSNATQEKQKTAVELFQTGDKNIIHHMSRKLGRLLSGEYDRYFHNDTAKHLTLQEFQDNFEWDESYSVKTSYEMSIEDHTHTFACLSKEEALAYVNGEEELGEPDMSNFYPEWDFAGGEESSLVIEVENLRLKPQQPKQKTWKLFFEVLADSSLEDHDLDSFCGQVALFATHQGGTIQVVRTDLSEGDSLTTTWSEVIGQK